MTKLTLNLTLFLNLVLGQYVYAFDMASMLTPQIQDIRLISFSAEKQNAVFEVDVYNPNEFKIPVREMSGEVFLNKERVSTLEASSKKSLAALSTQIFTVPITVDTDATVESANNIMLTGIAKYEFNGYMMTPVGEIPINKAGQLTAEQILVFIQAILFKQDQLP